MNILFLMDPLETVIFEKDTSLALMRGAQRRGHKVFYLPKDGISFTCCGLRFHAQEVEPPTQNDGAFIKKESRLLTDDDADILFIRTDPPFDPSYLMNTWLLDKASERMVVINRPSGIRTANEKLWCLQFSDLVPSTIVSSQKNELMDFIASEQTCIVKPINGFGGQGIFKIEHGDQNTNVILETLTQNFQQKIIIQRFIPEADLGDKRILLLNGEPLGAVLRVHASGDHRNNFFSGGKPHPAQITKGDMKIIERLKPSLRELGLYFAGIDILGEYLIEVNVTSPTCLQEMNRFNDKSLEDDVIIFAEDMAAQGGKNET